MICKCKACNPKIKIKTVKIPEGFNWRNTKKEGKNIEIEFVELVGKFGKCNK